MCFGLADQLTLFKLQGLSFLDQQAEHIERRFINDLDRRSRFTPARRRQKSVGCCQLQKIAASQFEVFEQLI